VSLRVVFIFIFLQQLASAQLFFPSLSSSGDKIPNFNQAEIKKNRIKSIIFDMVDKKDFQVAEDKDLSRHYEFDSLGRLKRSYYTIVSRVIQKEFHTAPIVRHRRMVSAGGTYSKSAYEFDTISCIFLYDEKNNLTCKRMRDGNFYNATYYWYDSIGRVNRMLSCKETNSSTDASVFTLGTQQILFDERYKYVSFSENQYKQLCLNDENRVYKEVIVNLNKSKQPVQYSESFVTTWINQITNFTYNEKGQLTEKKYTSNAAGSIQLRETYEYKNGQLDFEKHFKNEILQSETGYVYDPDTKLVSSFVTRDPINKSMQIVKLIFSYYP
jgi:hypothetical protein